MQFDTTHFENFIKSLFLIAVNRKKLKYFSNSNIYKKEIFDNEEISEVVTRYRHLNNDLLSDNLDDLHSYIEDIDIIIPFFRILRNKLSKCVCDKLNRLKGDIQKRIRVIEKGKKFTEINIPTIVRDDTIIEYILNYKHEWLCSMINFDDYVPILTAIENCYGDKLTKIVSEYSCKDSFDYFMELIKNKSH